MTDQIVQCQSNKKFMTMVELEHDHYISDDGWKMRREYGLTPNGNAMNGRWVLRNASGDMVDFDKYRNDLAEHFRLKFAPLI